MKRYRPKTNDVEAVQLQESAFEGEHPNPEHVPGVIYDPVTRTAVLKRHYGNPVPIKIGDWIVRDSEGMLRVWYSRRFEMEFEPVETRPLV